MGKAHTITIEPILLKLRWIIILSSCLLFSSSQTSYAIKDNIRFERLTVNDGLSQNTIRDIPLDSKGMMWFATQDGLNRYDGYTFYHYRHNADDPYSLSNNLVLCLAEDRSGTLWIGTWNGGLNRFNITTEQCTAYLHHPADPHSLCSDRITAIYEEQSGILWIGTPDGLDRCDAQTNRFTHYRLDPHNPASVRSNVINCICEDRSGRLWIGTEGGNNPRQITFDDASLLSVSF